MDNTRPGNEAWVAYGNSVLRVRQLEDENNALRAQLKQQLQEQQQRHNADGESKLPVSTAPGLPQLDASAQSESAVPLDHYASLACEYHKLHSKHISLAAQHSGCRRQIEEANEKVRTAKKSVKEWRSYLDKRKTTSKDPPSTPAVPPVEHSTERDDTDSTPRAKLETDNHNRVHESESSRVPSSPPRTEERRMQVQYASARVTSSQTTVDEMQRQLIERSSSNAVPSSDDEPVFVSSRQLKRKIDGPAYAEPRAQRIKQEASSPAAAIELKSEPSGDRSDDVARSLTSDLDATETAVVTPRRPKSWDIVRPRATSEELARPIAPLNRSASSISLGDLETSDMRFGSIIKSELGHSGDRFAKVPNYKDLSLIPEHNRNRRTDVLRPISANLRSVTRPDRSPARPKPRQRRNAQLSKTADLSEDGCDGSSQVIEQGDRRKEPPADVSIAQVLSDPLEEMLNEPPPDETPDLRVMRDSIRTGQKTNALIPLTPISAMKPASPMKMKHPSRSAKSPVKRVNIAPPPAGLEEPSPPIRPEEEPLRLRDVRTLKMSDFKVNPKYLGSAFAFADTLRGRDQRRNLHVCSKPDCCGGALQKVIAMGGSCLSGKTDAEALEAYVGPNWRDFMSVQSSEKQKQVLTQAHAHCFANQHGKHRQAFTRRSTPPGLWRTDFPTTQEAADDRQKALEAEREAVNERHREAVHGGGRWIFRDE